MTIEECNDAIIYMLNERKLEISIKQKNNNSGIFIIYFITNISKQKIKRTSI